MLNDPIMFEDFSQAFWNRVPDEEIADSKMCIGAVRYLNLFRAARLRTLEIPYGWCLPQLVTVDGYSAEEGWRTVAELELPKREGNGMHEVPLDGLAASHLRVVCSRHYPLPPSGGNQTASPFNVPYWSLNGMRLLGDYLDDPLAPERDPLPVMPHLTRATLAPEAPAGMLVKLGGNQVRFFGERFSVGFSLQRPLITHMGWDMLGQRAAQNLIQNRVFLPHTKYPAHSVRLSGPHWRTLPWTAWPSVWGGEVAVEGNQVIYRGLCVGDAINIEATFTVLPEGLRLELTQRIDTDRPTLELEAWRFIWNSHASAVASMAMPRCTGRTGAAELPVIWSAPGHGCLSAAVLESSAPVRLQVDSHREWHTTFAGLVLGQHDAYPLTPFTPARGQVSAVLEFRLEPVLPVLAPGVEDAALHGAIRREWGPGFMFRPELAGYSNNALSTNCHLAQTQVTDMAAFTRQPARGPHPLELARHTITMALKEGRGYGDDREVYLDSDPSLLISAGRIQMTAPHSAWLREVWPWLRRTALRHLGWSAENGLVATKMSTGNRNQRPFYTCSGYDTIGCGHFDGYCNAETYRAWKNVLGLAVIAGDRDLAERMREAIARIKANYAAVFFNPKTGWLGSWRSRDGELHDYGITVQNAGALLYGLVDADAARAIMANMEAARAALGLADASFGFPACLLPIPMYDQMPFAGGTAYRFDGSDAFGVYCNGTLTNGLANLYLRALSLYGPPGHADRAAREILDAHLDLDIVGAEDTGMEFHSFDGVACGYEGAYTFQFSVLLAAAQQLGWTPVGTPEFWPAEAEEA